MKKWRKWIRAEMDMEFFACVHWVSLLWCYSMIRWLCGRDGVSFLLITEMGIVSYVMAIGQRLIFCNERIYKKTAPVVRNILWTLLPAVIMIAAQFLLGWFRDLPEMAWISFDIILVAFLAIVEVCIHKFYEEDTRILNDLLMQYQGGRSNRESPKEEKE